MKRKLILFLAIMVIVFWGFNSAQRILALRATSKKVEAAGEQLEKLKRENADLKNELEYKKSNEFAEGEIRNKLGLAKKGEAVVVIPRKEESGDTNEDVKMANWQKWWSLFFGQESRN